MLDLEKRVIDNIKRIRKEKGISQERLAEACNTATSYIGLMEIYRNIPKLSTIDRIAAALDVDPVVFFRRLRPPAEKKREALRDLKARIALLVEKEFDSALRDFREE
jgi:transcriptional regulator with XRE-family HTH domain